MIACVHFLMWWLSPIFDSRTGQWVLGRAEPCLDDHCHFSPLKSFAPSNSQGEPVKTPPDLRAFALSVSCTWTALHAVIRVVVSFTSFRFLLRCHLLSKALLGCSVQTCHLFPSLPTPCPPCLPLLLSAIVCILWVCWSDLMRMCVSKALCGLCSWLYPGR